jgi:hypothetical protein
MPTFPKTQPLPFIVGKEKFNIFLGHDTRSGFKTPLLRLLGLLESAKFPAKSGAKSSRAAAQISLCGSLKRFL